MYFHTARKFDDHEKYICIHHLIATNRMLAKCLCKKGDDIFHWIEMISFCLKLLVKLRIQNYSDFHTALFYCPRTLNHKRKYWHGMLATKRFWHRSLSYGTKNLNCYRSFGSRNSNQPKHANSVRSMKILNERFAWLLQDWYKQLQKCWWFHF